MSDWYIAKIKGNPNVFLAQIGERENEIRSYKLIKAEKLYNLTYIEWFIESYCKDKNGKINSTNITNINKNKSNFNINKFKKEPDNNIFCDFSFLEAYLDGGDSEDSLNSLCDIICQNNQLDTNVENWKKIEEKLKNILDFWR